MLASCLLANVIYDYGYGDSRRLSMTWGIHGFLY